MAACGQITPGSPGSRPGYKTGAYWLTPKPVSIYGGDMNVEVTILGSGRPTPPNQHPNLTSIYVYVYVHVHVCGVYTSHEKGMGPSPPIPSHLTSCGKSLHHLPQTCLAFMTWQSCMEPGGSLHGEGDLQGIRRPPMAISPPRVSPVAL